MPNKLDSSSLKRRPHTSIPVWHFSHGGVKRKVKNKDMSMSLKRARIKIITQNDINNVCTCDNNPNLLLVDFVLTAIFLLILLFLIEVYLIKIYPVLIISMYEKDLW